MTISGFVAYVKQMWKNKPDRSTPVTAERLLHIEEGIKGNSDAVEKIAAAVISQIINDPEKIASMAALFAVNEKVAKLNSDMDIALYYKGDIPNKNANDADVNGIYRFDTEANFGTGGDGSDRKGYGVIICWGTGLKQGENSWCWQRRYYTGDTKSYSRTRINADVWSNWSAD